MEDQHMTKTPQTGDTIRVTYDATLGWLGDNQPGSPGVVLLGQAPDGQNIHVQSGKDRKVVSVEVIEKAQPDADDYNAKWLEGYSWALTHLTDPGVLADARRLAVGADL